MAETKVSKKSKDNIQEKETKTKPKKTKVKDEPLEPKVSQVTEPLDNVKVVDDNVQVDVEIDLRSYNHSDVVGGYIRRKRLI